MMRTGFRWVALVGGAALGLGVARADEGMWTYNNVPKDQLKKRYNFEPTQEWLDHVRQSTVRFNSVGGGGGTGSFVSSRGLVMTNHHVGADCIQKLGKSEKDYMKEGFVAKTPADEIKCPDLELNVVTAIDDVTAEVKSVEKPGMSEAALNKAQKEKMAALEKSCADKTGDRCDVVTLYQGGVYNLYRYKKYTDVRLAFAPEFGIAFFGGDPDNFEFPRYDLDLALFRAYENGKEVHPQHWLKWSKSGAAEGELVFTSGNPGNTERLDTLAQLEFLRDVQYPTMLTELGRQRAALEAYAKTSPEAARQAHEDIFGVENSLKAYTGYLGGLKDAKLLGKKRAAEEALRKMIAASPEKQKLYGGVWDAIAKSQATYASFFKRYIFTEGRRLNSFQGSELFRIARGLVRAAEEKQKPNEVRLKEFRDSALPQLELGLFSPAPIYDGLEKALLTSSLDRLAKELGAKDPLVVKLLAGKTPEARAAEIVGGTKVKDIAVRKALYADPKAVAASKDPLIELARAIDPEARAMRKRFEDEVEGVVKKNQALLAKALFEQQGTSAYPDATFTLRLSFGKVAGYTQDKGGKPEKVPAFTSIDGLFQRAEKAGNKDPWQLPAKWAAAKGKLKGTTPFNLVSSNDIIGGNSGSPLVNRAGEVVGLIFDGNIQSLPGVFVYDEAQNRALSVHSSAMMEALRVVYGAGHLADELQAAVAGGAPATKKSTVR